MNFYLNDFYTLQIIFSMIFFAVISFKDKTRIILLSQFLFNQKYSLLYHRKDKLIFKFFGFINTLTINSIILSYFLLNLSGKMSLILFVKIAILLSTFFAIKNGLIYFISYIFEIKYYSKKYFYNYSSILFSLSLLFYPIIVFISYYNDGELIYTGGFYTFYIYILVYFFMKIIVIRRLNLFNNRLVFYNILYLCNLELFPYLLLFKFINSNMT